MLAQLTSPFKVKPFMESSNCSAASSFKAERKPEDALASEDALEVDLWASEKACKKA